MEEETGRHDEGGQLPEMRPSGEVSEPTEIRSNGEASVPSEALTFSEEVQQDVASAGTSGKSALSKEEILARSRKENEKNGDEREQTKWKWVTYSGYLATIITVVVIEFCYILLHQGEAFFYPLYVLLGTSMSAQTTCQAVVMKKGRGKTISIVCAVLLILTTIALWVLFILSLFGIEL